MKNKKVIEVFGNYWHNIPKNKQRDYFRLKVYKRNGYKTLILWEREIKENSNILDKIRKFNEL